MPYFDDPDYSQDDVFKKLELLKDRFAGTQTLSGRLLFRPKPVPPRSLYKYTTVTSIKYILANMTLRYTQSEVLDDVFEEAPHRDELRRLMPEFEDGPTLVIDVMDPEERLVMFDRVRHSRARMRRADVVLSDDIAIITCSGLNRKWRYDLGNLPLKYSLEDTRKPLALSLSEVENSAKMWALYGDNNRGVCLEFNSRDRYFRSNRDLINRAGYFAPIEYRDLSIEDYAYRFPHERFFIKSPEWAEQREWRRVEYTEGIQKIDWDSAVFTFPFPPNALRSLRFGPRCATTDINDISAIVRSDSRLNHITLKKTTMSVGKLSVEDL